MNDFSETVRQYAALSRMYRELYPLHCKTCHGQGVQIGIDWVPMPFGVGNCAMETPEPCGDCLGEGKCPRCGREIATDDDAEYTKFNAWYDAEEPCPHCGWNWGKDDFDYDPGIDVDPLGD